MGSKCSAPKKFFVIFLSKITVVFNSTTGCLSQIFCLFDYNYIAFRLAFGLFFKNAFHQFARAAF
jgi:hypothetical protein